VKLKKRYRVKITRWGYIYILITIIISLGAANTSNNLLYLLAAALLAIMLISGLSSMVNITGLKINGLLPKAGFYERILLRKSYAKLKAIANRPKSLINSGAE